MPSRRARTLPVTLARYTSATRAAVAAKNQRESQCHWVWPFTVLEATTRKAVIPRIPTARAAMGSRTEARMRPGLRCWDQRRARAQAMPLAELAGKLTGAQK